MRNLAEFPITQAEKIRAVQAAIDAERRREDRGIGDTTLAALNEVLRDLQRD